MLVYPAASDSRLSGHAGATRFQGEPVSDDTARPGILVLDDDPYVLELLARMLRSMGFSRVSTVSSASVALQALRDSSLHADVILCDLNMPEMDGIAFLQQLNSAPCNRTAILMSGEGARIIHSVQRLLDGGGLRILGALAKPAARENLQALLDCWSPPSGPGHAPGAQAITANEIHTASREHQWLVHYQPLVDLQSGDLVGLEALTRWQHPVHGLLYPDRFVALAEECGAIDTMTDLVVREAIAQRARWLRQGLKVRLSINLSMESLGSPDFARRFGALVRAAGATPQDLVLEITESRLMSPTSIPLENLVRLRLQRFALSIDDFGTGHSSLAQLRDVPFTELKVDRGFVQGARHNQITRPILEGSVSIAKRLSMSSVAEGVESESDWFLVRDIGCEVAQGYFIGGPMSADKFWPWLNLWRARQAYLTRS